MTRVTCKLTAKNRDQLRNPTLGNRVWSTFFKRDVTDLIPASPTIRLLSQEHNTLYAGNRNNHTNDCEHTPLIRDHSLSRSLVETAFSRVWRLLAMDAMILSRKLSRWSANTWWWTWDVQQTQHIIIIIMQRLTHHVSVLRMTNRRRKRILKSKQDT